MYNEKRYYQDINASRRANGSFSFKLYGEAYEALSRQVSLGALVISRDALDQIELYLDKVVDIFDSHRANPDGAFRELDKCVDENIQKIVAIARKDLETTGSLFGDPSEGIRRWAKARLRKPPERIPP